MKGFSVGGVHCGIKKSQLDLAFIKSSIPCNVAALFTKNRVQAAPVLASKEVIQSGNKVSGVLINSGCANAVTGTLGMVNAKRMRDEYSQLIGGNSLVMSTGVIGQQLGIEHISNSIQKGLPFGNTRDDWESFSRAICTTDTFPKLVTKDLVRSGDCFSSRVGAGGDSYSIAGIAKGAGMIHPNMATMLSVIATDIAIEQEALHEILNYACERSFNCISVDGDTSTNDTVAILANGAAGGEIITRDSALFDSARKHITELCTDLAKLIVKDGEGATKFITINVKDANTYSEAKQVASQVATSSLVKTAIFGQDANWGRILCAVGYSGVEISPEAISVSLMHNEAEFPLLQKGEPVEFSESEALEILKERNVNINISLGMNGSEKATYYTCDLSKDYIDINASYRS